MPSAHALEAIVGQDRVRDLLVSAVVEGRVSHAYLFVGAPGSGTLDAAQALAQCLVCPNGGDATCEECRRVAHHTHPDVHFIAPQGVGGYLAQQVRELIADVQMAPVRANVKVYVLERVEQLRDTSANALLKTLEEPPEGVVFILCGTTTGAVLPTIVSRCQVVPFDVVSPDAATAGICAVSGASEEDARIALAVAGTPARAMEFLASPSRQEVRRQAIQAASTLAQTDAWGVLQEARALTEAVDAPLEDLKEQLAAAVEQNADYLSRGAIKQMEDANKREVTARRRLGMMEVLAAVESLLRDCLMRREGAGARPVNVDATDAIERIASTATTQGILDALAACSRAAGDLAHNVSPQLTLEVMLCNIKEALA